jgi:hypothetical protein
MTISPLIVVALKFSTVPKSTSDHPAEVDLYMPEVAPPVLFLKA